MQCACAILSTVVCTALQYFYTLSPKRQYFRKKNTEHKVCVLIFSTAFGEIFLILRRNDRNVIKIYIGAYVNDPLFLSDFNGN
jgi:hypothetical protein